MDVEAFILCDCATDQQGKLNILGAFDRLYTRKIPAVHPACAVAVRLRFSKFEEGEHTIKINLIDADGNPAGYPANPNGSAAGIAGLCNAGGNVFGLMPHPEDHVFAWQHPHRHRGVTGMTGLRLFQNGIKHA